MDLITSRQGEAHVSVENDSAFHRAIAGVDSCIFTVFSNLRPVASGANAVTISKGLGMIQGRLFYCDGSDVVTIPSGTIGKKRIDLICAKVEIEDDEQTGSLVVVTGTETTGTPVAPSYSQGNLDAGSDGLYAFAAVTLNGVSIQSVASYGTIVSTIFSSSGTASTALTRANAAQTNINSLSNTVNSLSSSVNSSLNTLNSKMTTAQNNITSLTGRVSKFEVNKTGNGTRNTNNTSDGTCVWHRYAGVVVVTIYGLKFKAGKATTNGLKCFSGLPKPNKISVFGLGCGAFNQTGFTAAFRITANGDVEITDAGTTASNYTFRGKTVYFV